MKEEAEHIKKILAEKFAKFVLPDEGVKKDIQKTVKTICGVDVGKEDIQIRQQIIYIKTKPSEKNELFINKKALLASLKNTFGTRAPKDIR